MLLAFASISDSLLFERRTLPGHFVAHQSKFAMLGRLGDLAEGRTVIAMEVHIRADDPLARLRPDPTRRERWPFSSE